MYSTLGGFKLVQGSGSSMVEVRLFKDGDNEAAWQDVAVSSYLPVFLSGEQNVQNITKRIELMYFKRPSAVLKIRWNIQSEPDNGYWIESPF